ncbi:MAG: DMT family transporter [Pseudomonadota bacterium]
MRREEGPITSDLTAGRVRGQSYRKGVALVLLGSAASSWLGLGVRAMEAATAWQILAFRALGLIVFLTLYIALTNSGRLIALFRGAGLPSLVGGIGLAVVSSGGIVAIQKASVANAMFLIAAAPFMAAVMSHLLLKEKVRTVTWLAIACSFLGIVMMVAEGISFGFFWGNVAGLIAAVGMAVFVVSLRWGHLSDMLPLSLIGGVLVALTALAVTTASGDGLAVSWHDALLGLAMGAFQLGIALVLITRGSRSVPGADLALLTMLEMVLAPFWVWLVFGETAGFYTLIGGALVLGAIALDALTGLREG